MLIRGFGLVTSHIDIIHTRIRMALDYFKPGIHTGNRGVWDGILAFMDFHDMPSLAGAHSTVNDACKTCKHFHFDPTQVT